MLKKEILKDIYDIKIEILVKKLVLLDWNDPVSKARIYEFKQALRKKYWQLLKVLIKIY